MLSDRQVIDKLIKVKKTVDSFLGEKKEDGTFDVNDKTIEQVSLETGYSSSSVQRYLNDHNYIKKLYPDDYKLRISIINLRLSKNKVEGNKKRGINFIANNTAIKDELGHFNGSRRK